MCILNCFPFYLLFNTSLYFQNLFDLTHEKFQFVIYFAVLLWVSLHLFRWHFCEPFHSSLVFNCVIWLRKLSMCCKYFSLCHLFLDFIFYACIASLKILQQSLVVLFFLIILSHALKVPMMRLFKAKTKTNSHFFYFYDFVISVTLLYKKIFLLFFCPLILPYEL